MRKNGRERKTERCAVATSGEKDDQAGQHAAEKSNDGGRFALILAMLSSVATGIQMYAGQQKTQSNVQ